MARAKPKLTPNPPADRDLPPFSTADKHVINGIIGKEASTAFLTSLEEVIAEYRYWYRFSKQMTTPEESRAALKALVSDCKAIRILVGTKASETAGALRLLVDSVNYHNPREFDGQTRAPDPKDKHGLREYVRDHLEGARENLSVIQSCAEHALANLPKARRGGRRVNESKVLATQLASLLNEIGIKPTMTNSEEGDNSKYLRLLEWSLKHAKTRGDVLRIGAAGLKAFKEGGAKTGIVD